MFGIAALAFKPVLPASDNFPRIIGSVVFDFAFHVFSIRFAG